MTWQSSLQLTFDYRVNTQKTRLCHCLHEGALMVQRPLYPEPEDQSSLTSSSSTNASHSLNSLDCPSPLNSLTSPKSPKSSQSGICHIYVLYPPAGIADGDKLSLNFDLKSNSHAVITTPGAGKWYGQRESLRRSNGRERETNKPSIDAIKDQQSSKPNVNIQPHSLTHSQTYSQHQIHSQLQPLAQAEQNICVALADNAILEWLPQESIYFDHSVSKANNHFDLAATASLLTWDIAVFGRQAYNETFTHGQYNTRLQIWRDDQLLVSEHTQQQANSRWFQSPLGLNKQHVHGSFWAVPSQDVIDADAQSNPLKLGQYLDNTIDEVRKLIDQYNLPIVSTHNYHAINCRYIGTDVRACFEAFYLVRELLRKKWYQLEPHRPRIWDT